MSSFSRLFMQLAAELPCSLLHVSSALLELALCSNFQLALPALGLSTLLALPSIVALGKITQLLCTCLSPMVVLWTHSHPQKTAPTSTTS
jgi:hypothetical protein